LNLANSGDKDSFFHPTAIVASSRIGSGTRIWAFCNIQEKASIGADCNICDHCFVENNVIIGDRVTVKNGVSLWDGVVVEDDVFIGPHAVFTNDIFPRSKVYINEPVRTLLEKGSTIGAGAVIVAGNKIGQYAMIGAGAVVVSDIPDYTLWVGNPARQIGYICKCAKRLRFNTAVEEEARFVCECGLSYRLADGLVTPE